MTGDVSQPVPPLKANSTVNFIGAVDFLFNYALNTNVKQMIAC